MHDRVTAHEHYTTMSGEGERDIRGHGVVEQTSLPPRRISDAHVCRYILGLLIVQKRRQSRKIYVRTIFLSFVTHHYSQYD